MRRNCIEIERSDKIKLYVDEENAEDILSYCEQNEKYSKKYNHIKEAILRRLAPKTLYGKVKTTKDIWEIRFFPNVKGRNDRIYCKQYDADPTIIIIVMVELFQGKKSQKIDKRIQDRLDVIKTYTYDIE
ncbi:MAG: hypothetical protein U5Q03_17415 [Bacteroidota bacterium]|nr:hypothetical protein [Bacteroidota bacterium]